ncbi:AIPR family protein [Pedobacter psychrotolerans]|uniref:AIPR family protein n=1 Tax=Pedobacter psychrotolerans TaxID=1843235 RepID=UPI003F9C6DC2
MKKYDILLNILDAIIAEAPASMSKKYVKSEKKIDDYNRSRTRAFIHLYLKVSFGILDFEKREHFITDGTNDGGIDGYYINTENKTIYFIQSKFRLNEKNFEEKEISLQEVLVMDVNRILDGEQFDEAGNEYNGKIKVLQREISSTQDIARYSYQVIILANLKNTKASDLRKLTGGLATEVFDFKKCYDDLVFPVVTGTYFNATDLNINIDLSNKNAGTKISYTVMTKKGECEITVLFVPTIELGRIMYKYKNSILKYNPRSYLGHEGKNVNNAIKETILGTNTNEFALYNNGITMLSDETYINERIGQKNKAQLIVKNPQIINGGQTSYTLSRIFEENLNNNVEDIFKGKEVLLKVITLLDNNNHASKLELINDISEATNKQTPVINADKLSNDELQSQIQAELFNRYGILYERKRGEFADGIFNSYITEKDITERNLFFRMYYTSNGQITKAREKKLFVRQNLTFEEITKDNRLDKTYFAFLCFRKIGKLNSPNQRVQLNTYAKVFALTVLYKPEKIEDYSDAIDDNYLTIENGWESFLNKHSEKAILIKNKTNKKTGAVKSIRMENWSSWYNSPKFAQDIVKHFQDNS